MMALNTSYFQPEAVEKAGGVDAFLRGMLLVTAQVREAAHSLGRGLRAVTPHAFAGFWVCLALYSACGHSSCGWCSQLFVRSGACWGAGPACHQHSGTLRVSSLAVCCRSCQCMRATHMLLWRRCMSALQRGRDHGLGLYNDVRAAYGLPRVQRFSEVSSPHAQLAPSQSNVTSTRALLRLPPTRHSLRSSLPSMVLMTTVALLLLLQPTLQCRVSRAL